MKNQQRFDENHEKELEAWFMMLMAPKQGNIWPFNMFYIQKNTQN